MGAVSHCAFIEGEFLDTPAQGNVPIGATSIMSASPGDHQLQGAGVWEVATKLSRHITDPMVFEVFKSHPSIEFMQPGDVAGAILHVLTQAPRIDVNEMLIRPTEQAT